MEPQVLDRPSKRTIFGGWSMLRRFADKRQNLRVLLYFMLLLCDIVAIRGAFAIGLNVRGAAWLSPHGFDLGWLILPVHLLAGLRGGAYGHEAVTSRLESIRRASGAFMIAAASISMLLLFQRAGLYISRFAFGLTIVMALIFIAVIRSTFLTIFVGRDKSWMVGELLILDGGVRPARYQGEVLQADVAGIKPSLHDPDQLARLAELIQPYDRVIVSCSPEKRSDWAQMLKCYQAIGEVLLDDGSPLGAIGVDRFRGQDTVVVARGSLSLGSRIKKRAMDIIVAGTALVLLAPLLIIVAIAIKLDSPGPVFFAQPRVGRGNRMFKIVKFRSMRSESGDLTGSRSATRDDDRVTRVGRFIRMTSIDELPQLLNVLSGDMSIVGPRPHALGSLAGDKPFWEVSVTYWRRHTLRPGITGLAQIRGFRGATHQEADLQNRLQSDLEYISGWTLWRDVKILLATVRVLIHPQAY